MLLKTLMEDKQLDFNRPLLSVRRFSSTLNTSEAEVKKKTDKSLPKIPPLPVYKSELKSGPIRNPGTVPFTWEKTPGRPKDENTQSQALGRHPIAPKLPPGRILNVKQQTLDKGSDGTKSTYARTGNVSASSQSVSNSDNSAKKCESSIEETEETASSSTEDGDEAYVDALDTLSRTESFFLNCSVSGVSGLDDADLKPSGTFATDSQTRDFMMGRFLPAAKAMASETPQFPIWKQPIAREQPKDRLISVVKRQPIRQYIPNDVHFLAQNKRLEESDDEDDNDAHGNLSATVCGLLPRFCLMNPVPGMRLQAQEPITSVRRVKAKNLYSSSSTETHITNVRDAVYERRSRPQTADNQKTKLELKTVPNQKTCGDKGQNLNGSSLLSRVQGNVKSPNENKNSQSVFNVPKSSADFPEKAMVFEFNGSDPCGKGGKNFRELMACQSTKWESGVVSPIEKTLYIDSVQKVKSSNSNSCSSDTKRLSDDRKDDVDSPVKSRETEGTLSIGSSPQGIKHLNLVNEKAKLRPQSLESVDSNFLSSPAGSAHGMEVDVKDNSSEEQDLSKSLIKLTSPKVADNEKIDLERPLRVKFKVEDISNGISSVSSRKADAETIVLKSRLHPSSSSVESSHDNYSQLLPLPPPKSPSDSWLKRTLPTVSKKNSSSWSSLGKQDYIEVQASKTTSVNPKWETIVKTSNVMLRFSEELLAPIPEN